MSVAEDAAAGANATRGPRLSMEALSFLEANERELTMHPITLSFRSSGAALLTCYSACVLVVQVLVQRCMCSVPHKEVPPCGFWAAGGGP